MTWKRPSFLPANKLKKAIRKKYLGNCLWPKVVRLLVICHQGDTFIAECYVRKLTGYSEPLLIKGLGCCAKASSFCITTPGAIVLPRHVTGYGTTAGSLWTTIPISRRVVLHVIGSLKEHLAGKRFVRDSRVRQAVTTWPKPIDTHLVCAWVQALASRWNTW
jgi:hypothetical protein